MLEKREIIYRHLLEEYFENKKRSFTQLELSKIFKISLSTVNNALRPIREMGAIEVKQRSFILRDPKKILLYFATIHSIRRDKVYSTRANLSVVEIEKLMPSDAVFAAFSAFRFTYQDAPSDYSEVYVYANEGSLKEIKKRFPQTKGPPNIIVLEADEFIRNGKVSSPQIFVDLWNIPSWYAKEFLQTLEKRLFA